MSDFENNLADSSLSRILITPESTWGAATTGADNALAKVLPFTGESLTYTPTTITSATITSRRAQSDLILANLQAEGDLDGEFTEGNFDGLLKAALLSTGSTTGPKVDALSWELINTEADSFGVQILTGGAVFSNVDGAGRIFYVQSDAPVIRRALLSLVKGQAITIGDTVLNSGVAHGTYTVLSATKEPDGTGEDDDLYGITIDLLEPIAGITTPVEEGIDTITLTTQRIADGNSDNTVDRQSFTIEKQLRLGGDDNKYFIYKGMLVNSLTFSVSAQELATISVSFLGKNSEAFEFGDTEFTTVNMRQNATGLTNGTDGISQLELATVGLDNPSVNGSDDFSGIYQGGELQALVSSFSLTVSNNLRPQNALGATGAIGIGVGTSEVSGSVDVYLKDLSMYKKFIENDTSSLQFRFTATDSAGDSHTYQIYLPKIKFSNVEQPISSNNTDVVTTGTFTALYDADSNASIVISKA